MAQAIATATESGRPVRDALQEAALAEGHRLGDLVNARMGRRSSSAALGRAVDSVLAEYGYEPRADADVVTLANCPFHALAREHTDLVCGMNLDLLSGLAETCGRGGLQARLDPAPGRCCVTLRSAASAGSSGRQARA
jgi:predicted ArsR family transcriptional regulator